MSAVVTFMLLLLVIIIVGGFIYSMNCYSKRELMPNIPDYKKRLGIEPFVTYPHVTYDRSIIAQTTGYRYPWQGPQIVSNNTNFTGSPLRAYAAAGGYTGGSRGSPGVALAYARS